MKNGNLKQLLQKTEDKNKRREKKRKPKMRVSGGSVKQLGKIINK